MGNALQLIIQLWFAWALDVSLYIVFNPNIVSRQASTSFFWYFWYHICSYNLMFSFHRRYWLLFHVLHASIFVACFNPVKSCHMIASLGMRPIRSTGFCRVSSCDPTELRCAQMVYIKRSSRAYKSRMEKSGHVPVTYPASHLLRFEDLIFSIVLSYIISA